LWYAVRPDAIAVWRDERARRALSWYYDVMRDAMPAKFVVAKYVEAPRDLEERGLDELWKLHSELRKEFLDLWRAVRLDELSLKEVERPRASFLDVKVAIARKMLESCSFCENRCGVNRLLGQRGVCRLDSATIVSSYFHHLGEEAPLVPSGTIFYGGCSFRCVFCQNYDISQEYPYPGFAVSARKLAAIQEELRRTGARNVNHVGGDPTPNLHTILESFKYLEVNVPQIWNSNQYLTTESVELLLDVIDLWLPDFKYWSDECAARLSGVKRYKEVVTRNLKLAAEHGDMIIRHLVLPNHVDCCTLPILRWIAENLPREKVVVNIMDQYRPEYLVLRYPARFKEIARRVTSEEMKRAYEEARRLGLLYDVV